MKPVKASTLRARRMPPAKTASGGAPAILTKTLESVPVGRLRPHPKNPRVGQVETILRYFGIRLERMPAESREGANT